MNRIVISLYDSFTSALRAAADLVNNGFSQSDISLMAQEEVLRRSSAPASLDPQSLFGRPRAVTCRGVGRVMGSGSLLTGQTGVSEEYSLVDTLTSYGVPEQDSHTYAEAVRRGAVLLAAHVSEEMGSRAVSILDQHNPIVLEDEARSWRSSGWERFDESASPLEYDLLHWPHNITAFPGEAPPVEAEERNWPAEITDSQEDTRVREEQESNWPQNIADRTEERREDMEEEEALNWPHRITARDDEDTGRRPY